jgi:hypothetical protein
MGVVKMELNSNWKWIVLTQLQLSCTIYTVSCNFATHASCPLELRAYKYNELQGQLQNTFFFIMGVSHLESLTSM